MFENFMNQWKQPNPLNDWYDRMGTAGFTLDQAKDMDNFILGSMPASGEGYMKGLPNTNQNGFFGLSGDQLKLGLGGVQTLGNLWNSFQSNKLAKDQFKTSKDFATKNLANQIKSYNTALTDRITSRASSNGLTQEQVDQYIKENRM